MPAYDYRCSGCGHTFEMNTSISNRDKLTKKPCPKCKNKKMHRVMSAPSIGDSVKMGIKKVDNGFKEVMSKIKQHHPRHNIKDRY